MEMRQETPRAPASRFRQRFYVALEPDARPTGRLSAVDWAFIVIVLASLATLALETEPTLPAAFCEGLAQINLTILILFTIEYLARLWAVGEDPRFAGLGGRWRYVTSFYALADLAAFLPEVLTLALIGPQAGGIEAFKALRLLRLIKLARYVPAFDILAQAIRNSGAQLAIAMAIAGGFVYLGAIALYFIEGAVNPGNFGSIPRALWWAVVTLTTVGYGDVYPVTALGRVVAGLIAIAGIGIVALPTGILASAFTDELRRREAERAQKRDAQEG